MCPAGKWSADEAGTCTDCAIGKSSAASGADDISTCVDCAVGKSESDTGSAACTDCSAGTIQPVTAQTSCDDCATGKYKATTGQTECDFCSANSDSPAGSDEHDDCEADVGFTGSAAAVTACVAGTFKTSPMSSTACTDCVAGKFKIATTQTSDTCTDCDAGKFKETAAQSSDTCTDCDAGKFKETAAQSSDTCGDCPVNSNSPAASGVHDDCKADAGFTGSGVTVTACVAGTFKTSPMSSTACTDCDAGKFKAAAGQTQCEDCAAGKTSASPFTACVAVPGADAPSPNKAPNNITTDNDIFHPTGRDIVVVIMVTVAVVGAMVGCGLCWLWSVRVGRFVKATPGTKDPQTSV